MLYVNDFFVRNKEAVSNQMELLLKATGGKIISATRFMNQKSYKKSDRMDNIYIYYPIIYKIILFFEIFKATAIYSFEEEKSLFKRILYNFSKKPLYIYVYRKPEQNFIYHLKKYNNVKKIFVELDEHKQLLEKYGFSSELISICNTPAKFNRKQNVKKYNKNEVNILFASWNQKEGNALYDRGLLYILDLMQKNKNLNLTIPLRDDDTKEFLEIAKSKGLLNKIKLLSIKNDDELENLFEMCDFVSFLARKRIVKDVPNSLIDGMIKGKPILISDIIDFHKIVEKENVGIVFNHKTNPDFFEVSDDIYQIMSTNAYKFSVNYTKDNYVNQILKDVKEVI